MNAVHPKSHYKQRQTSGEQIVCILIKVSNHDQIT